MLTSFNKRSSWLAQSIEQIKTRFKCKYCDGNIRESYKKIEFRRDFDGKTLSNRKGKRVSKIEKVVTVNDKLDFTLMTKAIVIKNQKIKKFPAVFY